MDFHIDSSPDKQEKTNAVEAKSSALEDRFTEGDDANNKDDEQVKSSPIKTFFETKKEFFIAVIIVLLCGVLVFLFFAGRAAEKKARRIAYALGDYKYEMVVDEQTVYFAFKDGKMAIETHGFYGDDHTDNFVSGDIDNYNKDFKIVVSLLSNKTAIKVKDLNGDKWETFFLGENLIIDEVENVKYDDIIAERNDILCAHSYSEEVIKKATCRTEGEIKKTCIHCGKIKTVAQTGSHEYKDFSCVTCGKINLNNFKPFTAFKYSQNPEIYYTNCVIFAVTEYPTCVTIDYKPVCIWCNNVINAPVSDTYFTMLPGSYESAKFYCSRCGVETHSAILYG